MSGWEKAGVVLAVTTGALHGLGELMLDFVMDRRARESRLVRWAWSRSR